jgi:hypothetical protein
MQRNSVLGAAVVAALSLLRAAPLAAALPPDIQAALAKTGRFTPAELLALEQGTVIAHVEQGGDASEVVAIAAVKIRASRERTLSYYGQMITYVDGQVTLAFGKFSAPPALSDVAGLTLDADEVEALGSCQPKDCDLKLAGAGILRLRASIDWRAPDRAARVNAFVRQAAVDYVAAYLKNGDDALVTYDDKSQPVSLKAEWRGLLANSPHFQEYRPELRAYLERFPRQELAGAKDILYWVRESYGHKPVISFVHGVVYQPPQTPERTLVFQKQIYASHYYNASAALASIVEAHEGQLPVTYILYANRSRGDLLKGGFGGLKRSVARDQAQKAAKQTLGTIKTVLEQQPGR